MTVHAQNFDFEPAAWLRELSRTERDVIAILRRWRLGSKDQAEFRALLNQHLGSVHARQTQDALEMLLTTCQQTARHSLSVQPPDCETVSFDEVNLAKMVVCAAQNRREDAMMIACMMLRPDASPLAVASAQALGLGLARLQIRLNRHARSLASIA